MKFEYSADGGTSCPTTTAPVYDSSTPVTVRARCISDATCTFTETTDVTTAQKRVVHLKLFYRKSFRLVVIFIQVFFDLLN